MNRAAAASYDPATTSARITYQDGTVVTGTVAELFPQHPPTPEEIADQLIAELAYAFSAARDTTDPPISLADLRAAYERSSLFDAEPLRRSS
jgi:hypothetical protein